MYGEGSGAGNNRAILRFQIDVIAPGQSVLRNFPDDGIPGAADSNAAGDGRAAAGIANGYRRAPWRLQPNPDHVSDVVVRIVRNQAAAGLGAEMETQNDQESC